MERQGYERKAAVIGLPRRQQIQYATYIVNDLPDFVEWLQEYTASLVHLHGVDNVDVELCRLSELPSVEAESYKQMWAYGNHYQVHEEGNGNGYITQDYGIACMFGAEDG